MSHTSTPWATATGDETKIVYRPSPYAYDRQVVAEGLSPSDARHIVACVNACAGMDDPATEIARLREVNAALLEALKAAVDAGMVPTPDSFPNTTKTEVGRVSLLIYAAISKAEGGAE